MISVNVAEMCWIVFLSIGAGMLPGFVMGMQAEREHPTKKKEKKINRKEVEGLIAEYQEIGEMGLFISEIRRLI